MRLLTVEDDDDIAVVIEAALRSDGHSIDRAADGLDGLWMAREGTYGVIVLDVLLPSMNGFKICETLRNEGNTTPILMLTAKVGEYDETDGFEAGADDYLRKPFSPGVLIARVRALLRRGPGSEGRSDVLERGGVRLNPRTRSCQLNGAAIELSQRQSELLETLLRTGDEPLSRLELVKAVWGLDFDGDPNVADVYLRYLRAKLGKETIENVRGAGYRIKA